MFSPPRMIVSSLRPSMNRYPSASSQPRSRVGNQPVVVERRLPAGVLAGHLLAPHPDLAGLAGRERFAEPAADLDLDRGQHPPRRGQAGRGRGVAVAGGPVVVGAEHGDRRAGLGEPVGVGEVDVGQQRHHPLQHGGRRARPAVRQGPQAGEAGSVGVEHVADARQHRRDDHGVGDALAAHGRDPARGVELGEVDDAAPEVQVAEQVGEAGHVVRRHAHEHGVVGPGPGELDGADHVRREVAVPQHRRLGRRRRAAGVEQHRRRLAVGGHVAHLAAGSAPSPRRRRRRAHGGPEPRAPPRPRPRRPRGCRPEGRAGRAAARR